MDDYISKPVKLEELAAVLERWVSRDEEETKIGTLNSALEIGADPVDLSVLSGLRELQGEHEPDLLNELVALFLDEVPTELGALRAAIERDDAPRVEQLAHALKGSCGNMGAVRMVALCTELEEMGRSEDLTGAPELMSRLQEEFGRVRAVLEEERSRKG